ncbi:MAG: ABC transporter substrate-binding protein [Methanophagales archaeon]|nr:ABC transporter substrate-binding protein [Methanophagales archaeon]
MKQTRIRKGAAFGMIAVMVSAMLLASMPTVSASEELYGDANGDGKIDMRDVTYVGLIILGKKPANELADANQDGRVNVGDITYIELIILGKVQKYPLRLGLTRNEFKLMNALTRPWYDSANFFGVTHVGLLAYKPDLSIAPCLAKDWEISPDGKSIKFYLVKNARWHDGKPVTAEDVAFTYEYWKEHKLYCQGWWLSEYLDHAEVLDDYTIKIHFTDSVAAHALIAICPTLVIVPKHVWEGIDEPKKYEGDDAMIGCGPFIFQRYDKAAETVYLKANPEFFGGKPQIDRIEWRYYRTLDSLVMALIKGEIDAQLDYCRNPEPVYAPSLLKAENVKVAIIPGLGLPRVLYFGFRQYPTNVKEFREAVSYAIDYQALLEMIAAGYGEVPGRGQTPPVMLGFNPNLPKLEYNPDKAKEILDNAGFIDRDGDGLREDQHGDKLRIPIHTENRPDRVRCAEHVNYRLREVGLDTYVEALERKMASDKIYKQRDYYMFIHGESPYGVFAFAPGSYSTFTDAPGLYGTCKDPELLDLAEKITHSKDTEELKSWISKLQEFIAEELPAIALMWSDEIAPYRTDRWEGWVPMVGYGVCNLETWFNLKPVAS